MNTLATDYPAFSPYFQHEIEKASPAEKQKRWDAMCGECGGSEPA